MMLRDMRSLRWLPAVMTGALVAVLTVWIGLGIGGSALWLDGEIDLIHTDELAPSLLRSAGMPWLAAVAVMALLAAVMSTAASLLNTPAAAVARDLPQALGFRVPEGLAAARLATVAAGSGAAALALLSERPVALLGVLGWGTLTAALLPTVMIGLNWAGCTRRSAVAAMILGPAVQLGLEAARVMGADLVGWEPALTGASVGVVALVVLSRNRPREVTGT